MPNLKAEAVASEHFCDDWGPDNLMMQYYRSLDAWDFSFGEIYEENENVRFREVFFMSKVPPCPGWPRETRCLVTLRMEKSEGQFTLESSLMTPEAPFGSNFLIQMRVSYTDCQGGLQCSLTSRVNFIKSVGWMRSAISCATLVSIRLAVKSLEALLFQKAAAA